jgi:hypothetical protein
MSEPPSEWQTGINTHGGEQVGFVEAKLRAPAGRSLEAGGELRRRTRPSAPSRSSQGLTMGRLTMGRVLWRLSIALLWFVSICAGALTAVTLWVLFGFPPEPRSSDADTLGSRFEARKGESLASLGALKVTGAARPDLGHGSGTSSPAAAEPKQATEEQPQSETGAGADQLQLVRTEPRSAARQQEISQQEISTTRAQCKVDLCAARYKSFRAADCTYQPLGGGPRSLCEASPRSAEAAPQTSRAAADPVSEAKHTRVAETAGEVPKSAAPARAGAQCNGNLCAATYASFHAADCTYQPYDGGPRRICER